MFTQIKVQNNICRVINNNKKFTFPQIKEQNNLCRVGGVISLVSNMIIYKCYLNTINPISPCKLSM